MNKANDSLRIEYRHLRRQIEIAELRVAVNDVGLVGVAYLAEQWQRMDDFVERLIVRDNEYMGRNQGGGHG